MRGLERFAAILAVAAVAAPGGAPGGAAAAETPPGAEVQMTVKKMTPILFVDRIEPCLSFWVDGLGFEKTMEVPEGDRLGFVGLQKDGIEIMLQTRGALEKDLPEVARGTTDATTFLYLEVSDLAAVSAAIRKEDLVLPERKTFYGAREIVVREPGGHYVTFAQFDEAATD